jgi:hypothetical protein
MSKWFVLANSPDSAEEAASFLQTTEGAFIKDVDVRRLVVSGFMTDCFGPIAGVLEGEIGDFGPGMCVSVLVNGADIRASILCGMGLMDSLAC